MIKFLAILAVPVLLMASLSLASAQDPKTPAAPVPNPPQITETETLALKELGNEYQGFLQEYAKIASEISKSHPGYHLDNKIPFSGRLEKDAPLAPQASTNTKK
jgi:hypothetical protein